MGRYASVGHDKLLISLAHVAPSTGTKTNVSSLDILRFVPRQPIELRSAVRAGGCFKSETC
jgi:hypothetical protein